MSELKIQYIDVNKIQPYKNNARLHNNEQLASLEQSITLLGNRKPIEIDENGIIICGHGRFEVYKKLGLDHIPVIIHNDMTEEQKKAYRIADNEIALKSEWDFKLLNIEIEDINLKIDLFDDIKKKKINKEKKLNHKEIISEEENMLLDNYNNYYLMLSGGKDSFLSLENVAPILKEKGKYLECIYIDTGVEFPDLLPFIYNSCEEMGVKLTIIKSKKNFFECYGKKKKFPNSAHRECIGELISNCANDYMFSQKEDFIVIRGGRKKQKTSRSNSSLYQELLDYKKRKLKIYNPLFDVPEGIMPIHLWKGYDKGFDRTACWCCPFQKETQWEALKKYYPFLYEELEIMFKTWEFVKLKGDGYIKRIEKYWGKI